MRFSNKSAANIGRWASWTEKPVRQEQSEERVLEDAQVVASEFYSRGSGS